MTLLSPRPPARGPPAHVLFVLSRAGSLFRLPAWLMALTRKM